MIKQLAIFILLLTAPAFSQAVGGGGVPGANSGGGGSYTHGDFFWRMQTDGNTQTVNTTGSSFPPNRLYLNFVGVGTDSQSGQYWKGQISEEFFFPYAISSEAYANLRADQKAYYGTP